MSAVEESCNEGKRCDTSAGAGSSARNGASRLEDEEKSEGIEGNEKQADATPKKKKK